MGGGSVKERKGTSGSTILASVFLFCPSHSLLLPYLCLVQGRKEGRNERRKGRRMVGKKKVSKGERGK